MSMVRRVGFALLGMLLGAIAGAVAGLLGGLGYTELVQTPGFEGYSGFVVAFWLLAGTAIGMIFGLIVAYKLSRRWHL